MVFPWFLSTFTGRRYQGGASCHVSTSWEAGFHQILVTQPRRIAAISLARRVGAEQMDVAQGKVVGQRGGCGGAMGHGPWAMGHGRGMLFIMFTELHIHMHVYL